MYGGDCNKSHDNVYSYLEWLFPSRLDALATVCKKLFDGVDVEKADLLYDIFSMRLGDKCREEIRERLDELILKVGEDAVLRQINREINTFLTDVSGKLIKHLSDINIVFDDYSLEPSAFTMGLRRNIRRIYKKTAFLSMPGLSKVLNMVYLYPVAIEYIEGVRDLFSRFSGTLVMLDEYDVMLVKRVLMHGGETVSLSKFLVGLLDSDRVFLERTAELDIGILTPCNEYLDIDLKNYLYILDGMPNINYTLSDECVSSVYPSLIDKAAGNLGIETILGLFRGTSPKILLTIDPYFNKALHIVARGKPFVVGFLPNLVTRVMSKV